jgi:hypothetical protein
VIFFVVSVVLGLPGAVVAAWSFRKLVTLQYLAYRPQWEADGRPEGTWWHPGGHPSLWGPCVADWLAIKWLLVTPSWVRPDAAAVTLLRRYRICVALGFAAMLVGAAAQLVLG